MRSRAGKKQLWIMANNNETWIDPVTYLNIEAIYEFLLEQAKKAWSEGKRTPKYSYTQISNKIAINVKQVQFACQKLAYKMDPYIRIYAVSFGSSEGVKTSEKVELIRISEEDEGSEDASL